MIRTTTDETPPAVTSRAPSRSRRGLAHLSARRLRWLLTVAAVLTVVAAVGSAGTLKVLKTGGFDDPGSDSVRAASLLSERFEGPEPNLVIAVTGSGGVDDQDVARVGTEIAAQLRAAAGLSSVQAYWDTRSPALRSRDGRSGLVLGQVAGDEDASAERVGELHEQLAVDRDGVTVRFGGLGQINNDINDRVSGDLAKAEAIAIPITLALLVLVFGSVVAAAVPLALAIMVILGSLTVLRLLASATDVSVFSVNLVTALGLGLSIDYSLLVLSRYREERRGPGGTRDAVVRTLDTAGRTVLFSGVTVALSLAVLLIFPQYFLRSFAYAGIAVVVIAVLVTLTVLPAALVLLDHRIGAWSVRRLHGRHYGQLAPSETRWGRLADRVMRRPARWSVPVVAVLVLAVMPFLGAQFGVPDDRVLPETAESRVVGDLLRQQFPSSVTGSLTVVAPDWGQGSASDRDLEQYAAELAQLPGVLDVSTAAGTWNAQGRAEGPSAVSAAFVRAPSVWLRISTSVEPYSEQGKALARAVRDVRVPEDRQVLVGGQPAQLLDITDSIGQRLPAALLLIGVATYVLLFLLTGSVLLPLKALLLNVINLMGIFGLMVWVFQEGHLSGVLGFTPTPIATAIPVLLLCIAFGLSMDYEVFVLSRIKEFHDAGYDTRSSVVAGLGSSGRIISAAAGVLAVSFFAMLTSQVSFLQMLGLGTGLAIVIDAVVVRGVLVPALMQVAGPANWWAPGPLRRLHARFGLSEGRHGELTLPAPSASVRA